MKPKTLVIGNHSLDWGQRTILMGIINITPDSFSGDGLVSAGDFVSRALEQAGRFLAEGADILDIGGESTRPGAQVVQEDEEKRRVEPVIRAIASRFPEILISIDTYKAAVAESALDAGAQIINDVWGLRADPQMAALAAKRGAPVILMHNRSKPNDAQVEARLGGRYIGVEYADLLADVQRELMESVLLARNAGIADEKIILDPGIGFGKTVQQNLELLNRLDEICELGFPVLLGTSRKSFIGYTLDLPADQRAAGTAATVAIGIARGANIVRVHDVAQMTQVARMADAIVRKTIHR
ncbi:MAG: dihydropteroate synthase [Chloroflexi bacterium HGW-Chloroflexi-6]|nr:MAG: dihydropteroate synthase [Chloroflexi bacterium HGW-Chloroflexi-6]